MTGKETDRSRGTHVLETVEGDMFQNTERTRPSEGHSRPGDGRGSDLSGHGKKSTEGRTLTLWRRQRVRLVRALKEIVRSRGTHCLETAAGGTCQDTERSQPIEGHSQTGDGGGRDLSEHGKKPTEREALTSWRRQRDRLVRARKEFE